MILCPFHVNNGRVHYEILFSIVLHLYGLWHKLCNVKCMIYFDLRYACNHYDCLILVYMMILSLRQAFQGLTPNGSFAYLKYWNLEYTNVLKTPECFWGRKETEYICVIKLSIYIWYSLTDTWSISDCSQLTFSKDPEISFFYNFVLIMVIVFTITLMEQRH